MAGIPPSVNEFAQRFAGRYFGKYRGIVTRVDDDPNQLMRIMARVPVVLGPDTDVGWAWPADGGGAVESGEVWPPQVNDIVWVEFEEGDPQRPIWSHGPHGRRDSASMLPKHARGEQDDIDTQMRDDGIAVASQFHGTYPHVRIKKSPSGHLLEFDDTEDQERVQLAHRTGTRVEMFKDGDMEIVTADELRMRVTKTLQIETEVWKIELDDTPTAPKMRLYHKTSGDGIEYNGLTRSMTIVATSSLTVRSVGQVAIDALTCTILGRPVVPGGGPI